MKDEIPTTKARQLFPAWPVSLVSVSDNIITISLYHLFSLEPLRLAIAVHPKRYSHSLLMQAREFCLNLPTADMVTAVNGCGTTSGRDVNKYEKYSLTPEPCVKIKSKRIAECPLNIECRVVEVIRPSGGSHDWFVGEMVHATCEDGYRPGDALLYWGGKYHSIGDIVMHK